jgi:hypothetical protein
MRDCIKRLVEQSKGALNAQQAKEIFELLEQGKDKAIAKGFSADDYIMAKAAEIQTAIKHEALIEARNAKINAVKYAQLTNQIDDMVVNGLTVEKSFQAILVGVEANIKNGLFSIDKKAKSTLQSELLGTTISKMEEAGLLDIWRDSTNSRQIAREMQALNEGVEIKGSTNEVKQIAKILKDTQDYMKIRLNKAGADIGDLADYIAGTSHDQYKIQNAAYYVQQRTLGQRLNPLDKPARDKSNYEAWRDFILPKLDENRTFKDVESKEDFLRKTYDSFVTGIHLKSVEGDEKLFAFKGPANLAKKISQKRVLHFKDADSWHDYNDIFGTGKDGLAEALLRGFDKGARDIALLETLGTNPKAMLAKLLEDSKAKYRTTFNTSKLSSTERRINNFYANVSGEVMIAENPNFARNSSIFRAVQSMAKLGGALLSSFSDIPVAAAEISFQGDNHFTAQAKVFNERLKGRGDKFRRKVGYLQGQGLDAFRGAVVTKFTANDSLPGHMNALMTTFFKYNGLTWWTDVGKIGIGAIMSGRLAQLRGVSFDKLNSITKQIFNYYGIEQTHWDALRAADPYVDKGRKHLTADLIDTLDDNILANILIENGKPSSVKDIAAFKADARSRFNVYFQDRIDHAILEPGARENSILNQGLKRGTIEGEAVRFIMQFKSFPITFLSKVWGRELYAKGKADKLAMLAIVTATTIMGYASMTAKDLVKGKNPRDPFAPKTWLSAMLQGGGLGIMGDFVFGEYNRYGRSLFDTAAGPTFGALADVAETFAKARTGEDFSASLLNTTLSNTPFANLFYVREPLNRLFIYGLQEDLNPGYLKRMETRMAKENQQEFFIKP